MVEVREVKTRGELRKFVDFPRKLYRDHPYAVPDLRMDEMNNLNKKKNPAFEYCEARYFLAYKDGEIAGRIAAILSHKANEKWGTDRMRFCRVDFIDDEEVSAALFQAVENWARERGLKEVIGPIGFCDFDKEGMLVEGFEEKDMFITIYNYPYYIKHLEKLGYGKEVDWIEYVIKVPDHVDERVKKFSQKIMERYGLRYLDIKKKKDVKPYIRNIFKLLDDAYKDLYGTVPLNEGQIDWYVGQFLTLLNIHFIKVVLDKNDQVVAFGLAAPSFSEALRKNHGKLFPFGFIPVLKAMKHVKRLDLYFVAVKAEYINRGLPAILMEKMTESAMEQGVEYAETGPELEMNEKVQALWKSYDARQHRRRRCFIKKLKDEAK